MLSGFSEEFLLHSWCSVVLLRVSYTPGAQLFLVMSFTYTPGAQ